MKDELIYGSLLCNMVSVLTIWYVHFKICYMFLPERKNKGTEGNLGIYRIYLITSLWYWYQEYLHMSKLIKLYTLNVFSTFNVNYILTKLLEKEKKIRKRHGKPYLHEKKCNGFSILLHLIDPSTIKCIVPNPIYSVFFLHKHNYNQA